MKYPFFRFGPQYTVEAGHSLVEGYALRGRAYLWVFFVLCAISSVISTAGVGLLAASILARFLPGGVSITWLAIAMMLSVWLILLAGRYRTLDALTKLIVVVLTLGTVVTTVLAFAQGPQAEPGYVSPSPWTWASLSFLIALMGWMPAPIEISALNSLWITAKQRLVRSSARDVIFDFNVGFVTSAVLALFFLAMGALVQHGTGMEVPTSGGAYIGQLIDMYGATIGDWVAPVVGLIAFACMYGTTISVVDGYARASAESVRLLRRRPEMTRPALVAWTSGIALVGLLIMIWMNAQLAGMLRFAMISAFITAPVFAWLNFSLVRGREDLSPILRWLSYAGLVFLAGFTVLFLAAEVGLVG